jgi:ribonuclease-3
MALERIGLDNKGALQEFAQSHNLPLPRYRVVRTDGPQHARSFVLEVSVGTEWVAEAEGASKKIAGQRAAGRVLELLRRADDHRQ